MTVAPLTSDSLILASTVALRPGQRFLDLGCGGGGVAISVLQRCPGVQAEGIDIDPASVAATNQAARKAGLSRRLKAYECAAAAWTENRPPQTYDAVVCNPPFFVEGAGRSSPDEARNRARRADEGTVGDWVKLALRLTKLGGQVHFIVPANEASATWYAARLGAKTLALHDVNFKAGDPAKRVVMIATRGSGPVKRSVGAAIDFHLPAVRGRIEAGQALWQ